MKPGDLVRSSDHSLCLFLDESDSFHPIGSDVGDEIMIFLGSVSPEMWLNAPRRHRIPAMCKVLHPVYGVCRFYYSSLRVIDEAG